MLASAMRRLSILICMAGAACGGAPAPVANHAPGAPSEIRAIDWQNRAYTLGNDLGTVTVVRGDADFVINDDGKIVAGAAPGTGDGGGNYHVDPPLFADINGDGTEDAVVSAVTSTGGTGHFSEVDVYTVRDHQVVDLAAIPGGDRGDGGIRKVSLSGTTIVVERNVLAEGDGICCASNTQHERWRWQHGELAEDVAARKPGTAAP
jgi:hypothetical protein